MTRTKSNETATQIKEDLEAFASDVLDRDVLACQTALVNSLLAYGDRAGWTIDHIENLYPDVDMAGFNECHDLVLEHGGSTPEPNPHSMGSSELLAVITEATPSSEHPSPGAAIEHLRRLVIEAIDRRLIEGLDDWQRAARDTGPVEIFEWWLVTDFLAFQLRGIGEPVLDNEYGCWWGRTCTGQSILLDGTLQQLGLWTGCM